MFKFYVLSAVFKLCRSRSYVRICKYRRFAFAVFSFSSFVMSLWENPHIYVCSKFNIFYLHFVGELIIDFNYVPLSFMCI